MCGIFGWIKPKTNTTTDINLRDALVNGLIQTQSRGQDATGFYSPHHGIIKEASKATDFVKENIPHNIAKDRFVIGHCRAATQGDSTADENAHPFESKSWILVHNGIVRMKEIPGYKYTSDVDSERLLSHIEANGITKGIRAIDGNAAIVVFNKKTNKMYFWTDSTRPLAIAYYHGIIFFASTKAIIRNALKIKNELGIFPKVSFAIVFEHELLEFDLAKGIFTRKSEIEPKPKYDTVQAFEQIAYENEQFVPPTLPSKGIVTKAPTYRNPTSVGITYQRPPLQKGCWVSNKPPKG